MEEVVVHAKVERLHARVEEEEDVVSAEKVVDAGRAVLQDAAHVNGLWVEGVDQATEDDAIAEETNQVADLCFRLQDGVAGRYEVKPGTTFVQCLFQSLFDAVFVYLSELVATR